MDAFEQKNHKAQILETIDKKSTSHISGKHFTHFLPFSLDLKKMQSLTYQLLKKDLIRKSDILQKMIPIFV